MFNLLIGLAVLYFTGTPLLVAVMLGEEVPKEWRIRHLAFVVFWPVILPIGGLQWAFPVFRDIIRRGW